MANSVDPEAMAAAARNLSLFKELFANSLAQNEHLAFQYRGSAFGTDEPGTEMLTQYDQIAKPLWDNANGFDDAVGRVGDTAHHSANAWDSTSQAPNFAHPSDTGTPKDPPPKGGAAEPKGGAPKGGPVE
jgi:hypothetical protein